MPRRARDRAAMLTGQRLAHYRILRKLGSGGMGDVYLAEDTVLGRSIALKVLPSDTGGVPDRMRRFVEEAKAASTLNHPHIATIHELRECDGIHFIVMEYVEGQTLKAKLANGPLAPSEMVKLATQIAEALDAAHTAGIIHRDIKSANIMITRRGHAKVLDFGLAKRTPLHSSETDASTREATQSPAIMGTVPYMSPEQALGRPIDQRSDLFSLGVVLYEMSTGRLPFSGATPYETIDNIIHRRPEAITAINPNIPPALEGVILRCLEKRSEDRVQTAGELASDLRRSETDPGSVRRADVFQTNLPQQLTPFIGRLREIVEIRELLEKTRLVTLSGPGGIGKTRLALELAAELSGEYENGVWLVELASLADAGLVPQTVASTLGVREQSGRSITDTVVEYCKSRRLLLVLDNCEHLIAACAYLTDTLLRHSATVRVLTTSREPLAIAGETVFRVPSLGVPDPQRLPDLDGLAKHEAIELFADRARAVKSTFVITSAIARPLANLCVQLEGIPLAIELAASRLKVLSIEQIAVRLDDRLSLLTGGSRAALPRQQTLFATIDWSYNLLTDSEKILFRRLAVFSGGWTLEAAEAVCAGGAGEKRSVLELLSGLVDKSLVVVDERDGLQRYRLMVMLLEYARKRLIETEEKDVFDRVHAEFFLGLALESRLEGTEQHVWLERLNAEYDNIRAALDWTLKNNVEMGLRLTGALGRFWLLRGYWAEGRRRLEEALHATGESVHVDGRVTALNAAAYIAEMQDDHAAARTYAHEALTRSCECGDTREIAVALNNLAVIAGKEGNYPLAQSLLEESLTNYREFGDKGSIANTLNNVGIVALRRGDYGSAKSFFEESVAVARDMGDKHRIAAAVLNRGEVAKRIGDYLEAQSLLEEGLALATDIGDKAAIPVALESLGELALRRGDYAAAQALLSEGLEVSRETGEKRLIVDGLLFLGLLAGDDSTARLLFEESLAVSREVADKHGIAAALNSLGGFTTRQGDYAAARSLHEESLAICRQAGTKDDVARSLTGLANVARLQGDLGGAVSMYKQTLALWWDLGEKPELPQPLEYMAAALETGGQHGRAVCLWGAAQALRALISVARPPYEAEDYDRHVGAARAALGAARFTEAWAQGQAMGIDRAVRYALESEAT